MHMDIRRILLVGMVCFSLLISSSCATTSKEVETEDNSDEKLVESLGNILFPDPGLSVINDIDDFSDYLSVPAIRQDKSLTAEQKTAALLARSYLIGSAFSRSGLISQLQSEGYSFETVEAAIDILSIDWQVQAVKRAKLLTQYEDYTLESLQERLLDYDFTTEESEYAADYVITSKENVGIALLKALSAPKIDKLDEEQIQEVD